MMTIIILKTCLQIDGLLQNDYKTMLIQTSLIISVIPFLPCSFYYYWVLSINKIRNWRDSSRLFECYDIFAIIKTKGQRICWSLVHKFSLGVSVVFTLYCVKPFRNVYLIQAI